MKTKLKMLAVCVAVSALVLSPSGAEAATTVADERPAVVTVSESPATRPAPVVVKGPKSPHSFRGAAAVPASGSSGSLRLARPAGPDGSSAGEVVVRNAAVSGVTVPSNYVYDPSLGRLHDFCTNSPETYVNADFRGPCARHDLCYEAPGDNKINCDNTLYQHMRNNCAYAYPYPNWARDVCVLMAAQSWPDLTAFGDDN